MDILFENLDGFPVIKEYDIWYNELITMFENANCSKSLLLELKKIDGGPLNNFDQYTRYYENPEDLKKFFKYLDSIKMDKDYLEEGIRYAIRNIRVFGCLIVCFVNYVVLTKFDDIKVDCNIEKINSNQVFASCKLGAYTLCSMELVKTSKGIWFDNLKTKEFITNNNIGQLMLIEVSKKIKSIFPNECLYAINVGKNNHGGIRFYERLGAKFKENSNDYTYTCVFDPEAIEKISNMTLKKPDLYPLKNIYVDNPNIEIFNYLCDLIDTQISYTSNATVNIPKKYVTPQQIILSKAVVEKMLLDENIEYYGASDDLDAIKVIWYKEGFKRLIMEIRRNDLDEFELTKFLQKSKNGYEEILYDIEDDVRKRGILTISDKNDDISDVYKLS